MKITICLSLEKKTMLEPTYYLAALGAARVGLVQLHPWSRLLRLFRLVENVPGSRFSRTSKIVCNCNYLLEMEHQVMTQDV